MPTSYTLKATELRSSQGTVTGNGEAYSMKGFVSHMVVPASTAQNATIRFGYLPSNARLSKLSTVQSDDLGTTVTLDIGLGAVDGNITDDPDALLADLDVNTGALAETSLISTFTDNGKRVWELAGASSDPGGVISIYGTIADSTADVGGDIVVQVYYYLDS